MMVDVSPGDVSRMPRQLQRYWLLGAGAAKIGWGRDGDFNRCVVALTEATEGRVSQRVIKGACSNLHVLALGKRPGKH